MASGAAAWRRLRRAPAEPFVVLGVLLVLEILVFGGYLAGTQAAPWDFLGMGNAESFAWWHDGSFADPPEWMPYLLGGYPSALSLSGSWYLPVGALATAAPFTIHAAAVLQALHVGFGALGAYVLSRRAGAARLAAGFGLVAYFFAVGFVSNAQHVDIVRAFAWAPWALLCTSPWWPWRRPWGVPLAAVVLWQTLVGSYQGATVMLAYGLLAWVVLVRADRRVSWRADVLPLLTAGVAAVLLSMVKYLPFVMIRGLEGSPREAPNTVDLGILGTLFYPFDLAFLPNDVSMRSLFVVAPVLPLAMLARRSRLVAGSLALLGVTLLLGPRHLPWSDLAGQLPGMSLSRFQTADARVVATIALVLLAVSGLHALLGGSFGGVGASAVRVRAIASAAVPFAALLLAFASPFPRDVWLVPFVLVLASAAVVVGALLWASTGSAPAPALARRAVAVTLAGLGLVSGLQWATADSRVWAVDRVEAETDGWGATSGDLIQQRSDPGLISRRPARTPLPVGYDDELTSKLAVSQLWNGAYYTGVPAVGGYVNIYGLPTTDAFLASLVGTGSDAARAFWSAPGIVVETPDGALPGVATTSSCVSTGVCGPGLTVQGAGYVPGEWRYSVTATTGILTALNEAYWPGMVASLCDPGGTAACLAVPARLGPAGNVEVEIPPGEWQLVLRYETPGLATGWVMHLVGWVLLAAATLVFGRSRRRRPVASVAVELAREASKVP